MYLQLWTGDSNISIRDTLRTALDIHSPPPNSVARNRRVSKFYSQDELATAVVGNASTSNLVKKKSDYTKPANSSSLFSFGSRNSTQEKQYIPNASTTSMLPNLRSNMNRLSSSRNSNVSSSNIK